LLAGIVIHDLIVDWFALHLFYLTAGGEGREKAIDASEESEKSDNDEEEDEDEDDIDDLSDLMNVSRSDDEGTENEG
jgi:hypothetical protein